MAMNALDLRSVVAKAKNSEGGEAYLNLKKSAYGRLGVCVSDSEGETRFVLELLVIILGSGPRVDLDQSFHGLDIARAAERLGFELTSQGDGWIYCHKNVLPEEMEGQCTVIGQLIE